MNSIRPATAASGGRRRQTNTMLEASAFAPIPTIRLLNSVRIGQVPVTVNPDRIRAARKVSHPVLETPLSCFVSACLKA